MKLTKNTWHYNAYQLLTGNTPNNNFCDYFWTLLINVILFPLAIPYLLVIALYSFFLKKEDTVEWVEKDGDFYRVKKKLNFKERYISNIKGQSLFVKIFISLVGSFTVFILGHVIITDTLKFFIGIGITAGVLLTIIGLLYFFTESETKDNIANNLREIKDISVEGWKSFKGKYCPRITWKENKK